MYATRHTTAIYQTIVGSYIRVIIYLLFSSLCIISEILLFETGDIESRTGT